MAGTSGTGSGIGTCLSPQITASAGTGSSVTGPWGVGPSGTGTSSDEEEQPSRKRKPKWLQETLKEAEAFGRPQERIRSVVEPDRLGVVPDRDDMALVACLCDSEPSTFEEASQHLVWRDAMMEEYHSIMKNDAWEIVLRPEGKSVVTSRWLYKIKHAADGSVDKFKSRFVA